MDDSGRTLRFTAGGTAKNWGNKCKSICRSFRPSVARAGIHCIMKGIPACAGMTVEGGKGFPLARE